ncbi:MAG: hypothetical protein N3I35_06415 [Clostridia bacterium]|nr:hypothetical protein [Clostridia bacterium]
MSSKTSMQIKVVNARLLKDYGSWIYCDVCNSTVGYLCYTTYQYFVYNFTCNCGSKGVVEIRRIEGESDKILDSTLNLLLRKGRLCCPFDQSPLFSIVNKNVKECSYDIVCKKCFKHFTI